MSDQKMDRRQSLKNISLLAGTAVLPLHGANATNLMEKANKTKFIYCYNSSCTRGQNIALDQEIQLAAKAGFDGLELWIPVLNAYKESGKSLKDLKKKILDLGMHVEDAIGFAQWIHEDKSTRQKALEQAKREMDMLSGLGCPRIAAPPAGATEKEVESYDAVAERFLALLQIGKSQGVIPQLELWGFSKTLYKVSQLLYVAAQCASPETRLLMDVYHLFKGNSDPNALKLIAPAAIEIFHMNDYPASADRSIIKDSDRIYPGEGVAPLKQILTDLAKDRNKIVLSLEVFNPEYYKLDPFTVMKTGFEKMKAVTKMI